MHCSDELVGDVSGLVVVAQLHNRIGHVHKHTGCNVPGLVTGGHRVEDVRADVVGDSTRCTTGGSGV